MAVPSSGELKLWDTLWNQELVGSKGDNSLHSASVYAGFDTPDALSDFYGWSDVEVPGVTTNAMSQVSYYRMYANGTVNDTGNENPDRGFYFGTSANAYSNNTKYSVGTGGTGAFSRNMDSQVNQYNTTYYAWAYACNSAGETVGSRVQATTPYPPFSPSNTQTQMTCFYYVGQNGGAQSGYINPYSSQLSITGTTTATQYMSATSYPSINAFARNACNHRRGYANTYPGSDFSYVTFCTRTEYFNCCRFGNRSLTYPSGGGGFSCDQCMGGSIFYPGVNVQGYVQARFCAAPGPTQ